jgi:hypothetical protein
LKKRTKKLLLYSVRSSRIGRVNQASKSFLVLFFKKELLSYFADVTGRRWTRLWRKKNQKTFAVLRMGFGSLGQTFS